MVVATTRIAGLLPISSPYPNPAPSVVDCSPHTGETGQNAPSVSIKGNWKKQEQKRLFRTYPLTPSLAKGRGSEKRESWRRGKEND